MAKKSKQLRAALEKIDSTKVYSVEASGVNDSPHGQGTVTARLTATLKKSCGIHRQLI